MTEIVHSTREEQAVIWAAGTSEWGRTVGVDKYVEREAMYRDMPTGRQGGMSYWILTDSNAGTPRRLLSSMESLHRRVLVARPHEPVFEAVCHGIASVLTIPEHRGRGYATKLLTGVGEALRTHEGTDIREYRAQGDVAVESKSKSLPVACSVLFSDVGSFYVGLGWARFPSTHLEIPLTQPPPAGDLPRVTLLGRDDLAALCARDEELVRDRLAQQSRRDPTKTRVAVVPEIDLLNWHLRGEDHGTTEIFGRVPAVRGAMWTRNSDGTGPRIWIVIQRHYYGDAGAEAVSYEDNELYVLRLVVDEAGADDVTDDELARGLEAVLRVAVAKGREWRTEGVRVWSPGERVLDMFRRSGMEGREVVREDKEILSMNWYGEEGVERVEWTEGQKYAWC